MRCFMAQGGEFSEIINKTDADRVPFASVQNSQVNSLSLLLRSCKGNKIVITTGLKHALYINVRACIRIT